MWNLEKDPHLSASIANVTVFDAPPDPDRLRARLERAVTMVPRLRQRVVPALGRLAPAGVARRSRLRPRLPPALGRPARRPGRCGSSSTSPPRSSTRPFDRTRPLWEFVVIEGLEGDRAAMVQKLHHAIADGEGSIRMSEQFIDLARDATEPIAPDRPVPERIETNLVETTVDTLTHQLRRGLGVARRTVEGSVGARRATRATSSPSPPTSSSSGRSAMRQVVVSDPARSPLWTERSLRRRIEVLQVPLDDAKAAAKALGGSLNDIFVAAAAGGAGAYHRAAGTPVDELRITMPVSTRKDGSAGGNAFTPTRVLLPVGHRGPGGALHRHPGAPRHDEARAGDGRDRRHGRRGQPPPHLGGGARWPASRWRRSTSPPPTCGARRSRSTSPARASSPTTRSVPPAAPRGTSR